MHVDVDLIFRLPFFPWFPFFIPPFTFCQFLFVLPFLPNFSLLHFWVHDFFLFSHILNTIIIYRSLFPFNTCTLIQLWILKILTWYGCYKRVWKRLKMCTSSWTHTSPSYNFGFSLRARTICQENLVSPVVHVKYSAAVNSLWLIEQSVGRCLSSRCNQINHVSKNETLKTNTFLLIYPSKQGEHILLSHKTHM